MCTCLMGPYRFVVRFKAPELIECLFKWFLRVLFHVEGFSHRKTHPQFSPAEKPKVLKPKALHTGLNDWRCSFGIQR